MNFIFSILAFLICFLASDIGRKKEDKIEVLSFNWWSRAVLFGVAAFMFKNIDIWFP